MNRNAGHGDIRVFEREDGSVQLRDNLSRLWCACGEPAAHIEDEMRDTVYEYQCEKCNKKYHS